MTLGSMTPLEIFQYETTSGKSPYREWFLSLKDGMVRSRIRARVDRLALGNPGDHKFLGGARGCSQLINFLPHEKEVLWGRR